VVQVHAPEYGIAMQHSLHHSLGRLGRVAGDALDDGVLSVLWFFEGTLGAELEASGSRTPTPAPIASSPHKSRCIVPVYAASHSGTIVHISISSLEHDVGRRIVNETTEANPSSHLHTPKPKHSKKTFTPHSSASPPLSELRAYSSSYNLFVP